MEVYSLLFLGLIGCLMLILFTLKPYYFLWAFLVGLPFSYLVRAGPETSILKPIGAVLIICALPAFLISRNSTSMEISPLSASVAIFALGCFISLFSFIHTNVALWGFVFFLGNCLFYGLCIYLLDSMEKITKIIHWMCITFAISAAIGLLQKAIFGSYVRAVGTIQEPNYFALVVLPMIPIVLYLFWTEGKTYRKIILGCMALCLIIVIPLTLSRVGILVLLVSLFVAFIKARKSVQLIAVCVLIPLIFFFVLPEWARTGMRWQDLMAPGRMVSVDYRVSFLISGIRMFFDHPFLGVGPDNYIVCFPHYSLLHTTIERASAHNTYLEILTGTGLIGFIPYMAIIYFSLKNYKCAIKNFKQAGDSKNVWLSEGIQLGYITFLMGIFFLTAQHHILFWFFVALSEVLNTLSRQNEE